MIEQELFALINDNVTSVAGRVYPKMMPQDCIYPAVVYSVVNDSDVETIGCVVGSEVRFQIDIYGVSYSDVKTIKNEIKTALYGFTHKPYDLHSNDDYEPETKLYREMIDFKVKF